MRLAVLGKGGSGKSLIAGTLARQFARDGARVLALDLDFMPGISMSLGVQACDEPAFAALAERDGGSAWGWRAKMFPELAQMVMNHSILAPDGVRLLQIGKVKTLPADEKVTSSVGACYSVLRRLDHERSLARWTLVCDHPAGMIQSTGAWVAYARIFMVLVEPTGQSVLTARRLLSLRKSAPVLFVGNKTTGPSDFDYIESSLGEPLFGAVPADPQVGAANRAGAALVDYAPESPALLAIQELAQALREFHKSGEGRDREAK